MSRLMDAYWQFLDDECAKDPAIKDSKEGLVNVLKCRGLNDAEATLVASLYKDGVGLRSES